MSANENQEKTLDGEEYHSLCDMMMLLVADAFQCRGMLLNEPSDAEINAFAARAYARAVFAAIEGTCEMLRRQAFVAEVNKTPREIHLGRLTVLAGETYSVTDAGEIKKQNLRIPFGPSVLLSLCSYAEAQASNYKPKKGDNWHRVHSAVAVRDRVTHPKNLKSLEITNGEIVDLDFAIKWFFEELAEIFKSLGCDSPPMPDFQQMKTTPTEQ